MDDIPATDVNDMVVGTRHRGEKCDSGCGTGEVL